MGNRPCIVGKPDPELTVGQVGLKARDIFVDYWETYDVPVHEHSKLHISRRPILEDPFTVLPSEDLSNDDLLFAAHAFIEFSIGELAKIEIVPWTSRRPGMMHEMTKHLHCGHLLEEIKDPFIWDVGNYSGPGLESFARALIGRLAIAMRGAVTAEDPHHLIDKRTLSGEELLELYFRPLEGKSMRWSNVERECSNILETLEETGKGSMEKCE